MRLRSQRIVCPGGTVAGEVVVEGSRITAVDRAEDPPPRRPDREYVYLGDRWLVPGYIDLHVHGGGGAQFNTTDPDEVAAAASFHARHGTTGLLATTVAAPIDELCKALATIASSTAPTMMGAHLEGPFLNPAHSGAMEPEVFIEPSNHRVTRLLRAGAGRVRMMTVAPELPHGVALVRTLRLAGVVASIGHTNATDADVRAATRAGATAATHVFNAMPPFHHRHPGALGTILDLPELSCELISDGIHVDPVAMRLLHRVKGDGGIRLVTDAMAAAGMPDGDYTLGGRAVTVAGGRAVLKGTDTIAGSTLTMEQAVQNAVRLIGTTVETAVMMASTNPARLLGLEHRKGAIAPGLDADLLVLSEQLSVEATMVAGQWLEPPS